MNLRCLTVAAIILWSSSLGQAYWGGFLHCDRVTIFNCEVWAKQEEIESIKNDTERIRKSVNKYLEEEKERRKSLKELEAEIQNATEILKSLPVSTPTDWEKIEILEKEYFNKEKPKVSAALIVDTIIASGVDMKDTIDSFNEMQMTPVMDELDSRIRDLNLEDAGLNLDNHQNMTHYKNLLQNLFNVRINLHNKRVILKTLARETISRSNRLLNFIKKAEENKDNEKSQEYLRLAAKGMADLIQRSKKNLEESKIYLNQVLDSINDIDANLQILKQSIVKRQEDIKVKIDILNEDLKGLH